MKTAPHPMLPENSGKTLVLGLGNILCADEGIGCRIAEYLFATRVYPENVEILDGGTMGQELLGPVMDAHSLLIIDCADFGLLPGEATIRLKGETPIWLGSSKLSPHQGSFAEVLALAELKNSLPARLALLAIQPACLDFGKTLSGLLRAKIAAYAQKAADILAAWGHECHPRRSRMFLSDTPVAMQNYEPDWRI